MSQYWELNGTEIDVYEGSQSGLIPGNSTDVSLLFYPRGGGTAHVDRYTSIRDLTPYSGQYDVYENLNGIWKFKESGAAISPLIHLVPPDGALVARELWGLVDGYEDETVTPKTRCLLSLSIQILSIGSDFADESAFREAREVPGI